MILYIEYCHLNVVTVHHQLQNQKYWSLTEKPSEKTGRYKSGVENSSFSNKCVASLWLEHQIHFTSLQSNSYNKAGILAKERLNLE